MVMFKSSLWPLEYRQKRSVKNKYNINVKYNFLLVFYCFQLWLKYMQYVYWPFLLSYVGNIYIIGECDAFQSC